MRSDRDDALGLLLRRSARERPTHRALSGAGIQTLQRYVMRRASPTGWKYYSSWATGTLYDTEADAAAADAELERRHGGSVRWDEKTRFPTLYSYTHTGAASVLGTATQGPHTAPHVLVSGSFGRLQGREEWLQVLYEQVPDPERVQQIVCEEKRCALGELGLELQRYLYDYRSLYEWVELALWNSQVETRTRSAKRSSSTTGSSTAST